MGECKGVCGFGSGFSRFQGLGLEGLSLLERDGWGRQFRAWRLNTKHCKLGDVVNVSDWSSGGYGFESKQSNHNSNALV